ncbi:MAG TPA: hypothetical protein PLY93_04955, partial [Turneriella sp.]|nr:hypothetical protein [Turneriella sp.]
MRFVRIVIPLVMVSSFFAVQKDNPKVKKKPAVRVETPTRAEKSLPSVQDQGAEGRTPPPTESPVGVVNEVHDGASSPPLDNSSFGLVNET